MSQSDKVRILYIAGLGRNGGTLMDRLLGSVPGFASLGEVYFLWMKGVFHNELCNCGQPLRQCEFWDAVLRDTFAPQPVPDGREMTKLVEQVNRSRWIPSLITPLRPPGFTARLQRYKDVMQRLCTALHTHTGGDILVDSSKFASHAIILSQLPNVDLRVLHLVRDSRAAAFSWMKKLRKPEVIDGSEFMPRFSPTSTSVQWVYRNLGSHLLRSRANAYMRLRYEDFAASPREYTRQIVDWAGAPDAPLPFVGDNVVQLVTGHTQSGNPNRFNTGDVTIRPDMKWTEDLPRRSRTLVTALTWPLLLAYGYNI